MPVESGIFADVRLLILNSEVEKLVLALVVVPTSQDYVAASPQCFFTPSPGAPKRSDGGIVLEIPDIWPSNYPNKIVAGKSGSFKVRKPTESRTSTSTRTRTIPRFRDLG